ncbi:MAG: flagellar filament capping protein FliD [Aquabacterium sp.]|uniref:flagellar filament capping protein FliD n=1 Tax=Aquabacterium sp. TaxID=1872578 RepID=UPI0025C11810|nr:flagellar filament capping protein FliD [Aquabacterium sp.]MBI5927048.1 flagellar filament capping protein FliD [Aquabacterium sp.]
MATVGSASRVDGVDLQLMVNASAFARPQAGTATARTTDAEPDTRISSAGKLRSATSAVLDAAAQLNKSQTWQATKATSNNEALVQAVSDKAAPGDYAISVDALATAQTTTSASFSSLSTVVGIGTLDLQLGTWNSSTSTFATNPNWPKASVTFGPKDTSLEHIRDKINAAGVGVIATVVSDATGSRLVLRSTSTGSGNGFKVEAEPTNKGDDKAAQTLAAMGFNPAQVSGGAALTQPGQDARIKIDGREVQSGQNLIEDEPTGLTLRLNGQEGGSATIHVETDTQAMAKDIQSFAHAYNNMVSQLAQSDQSPDDSSVLDARAIQQSMQEAFSSKGKTLTPSGSQFKDIGMQLAPDGLLSIDTARLNQSLEQDPGKVEQLFDAAGGKEQASGIAARLLALSGRQAESSEQTSANGPGAQQRSETASTAGTLYRQRLLEQYAASSTHEDENAMSANEA